MSSAVIFRSRIATDKNDLFLRFSAPGGPRTRRHGRTSDLRAGVARTGRPVRNGSIAASTSLFVARRYPSAGRKSVVATEFRCEGTRKVTASATIRIYRTSSNGGVVRFNKLAERPYCQQELQLGVVSHAASISADLDLIKNTNLRQGAPKKIISDGGDD